VTAADSVGLMVDMTCRIVRVNNNTIGIGDIEMKNPGFQMVDPDDCVIVHGHKCSFRVAVAQPAERATETACHCQGTWISLVRIELSQTLLILAESALAKIRAAV
jgi:hypothetical protein